MHTLKLMQIGWGMRESEIYNPDLGSTAIRIYDKYYLKLLNEHGVAAAREMSSLVTQGGYYSLFPEDAYFEIVRKWRHTKNS